MNGTPRTFRDRKDMAYDAARLLKAGVKPTQIARQFGLADVRRALASDVKKR